ncbi:N-6 DNA methylase [Undibacterium fentianense]|uniref:site-specific DNA-methyltransferase (adenine-specific) n=1 Tax=Undibacterium fentianense TaxID=2828728 RepID=A0A941IFB9_9BURK|nr:N-6 DNA methylase [Undibacterium fentianense]MBR7798885.1 N-6 DNA methylase [Undibacterium fentianense]
MVLPPQLNLIRPSTTSDSWGRYYTEQNISDILIDSIGDLRPKVIVELGVGRGSISSSAVKKWGSARLVTVDTDYGTAPELIGLDSTQHAHFIHDALDDELASKIGLSFGSVDLGLCNPPYVRPKWRTGYGAILEEAGLSGALDSVRDAGADLLFIAQNLRLLKRSGKLGLILPDGLLTGEKFGRVRSTLLNQHLIKEVIQLPRRVFAGTDAQTHLLVLAKSGGATQEVILRNLSIEGVLSQPLKISADMATRRLDYSYHFSRKIASKSNKKNSDVLIEKLCINLTRGSFNSSQLNSLVVPIFHLSDFPNDNQGITPRVPKRFLRSPTSLSKLPSNVRIATDGDILIARIGRNLHNKICLVEGGGCVISDCVYSLKVLPKHREKVMSFFCSDIGRQALLTAAHGVGAKYLSRSDLMQITVPI